LNSFLGRGLLEGLGLVLLGLGSRHHALLGDLLQLGHVGLDLEVAGLAGHSIGETLLDLLEFLGRQGEGADSLAQEDAEGVEGLLVLARGRGSRALRRFVFGLVLGTGTAAGQESGG
jgi:hypothetical protein